MEKSYNHLSPPSTWCRLKNDPGRGLFFDQTAAVNLPDPESSLGLLITMMACGGRPPACVLLELGIFLLCCSLPLVLLLAGFDLGFRCHAALLEPIAFIARFKNVAMMGHWVIT